MRLVEVPCSQALAPSLLQGYDWSLNPYRGCAFDCLYCYAPDVVRLPRETWAQTLFVKRSIPAVLARELRKKPRGVIGISTVTDPYQPVEKKLGVTRHCLEVIAREEWPVSILTKSPLVVRDLDLLRAIPEAEVGITITTGSEDERRRWEPSCPPIPARFEALRKATEAGVRGFVFAGPLFPESTAESMRALVQGAAAAGAAEIIADEFHSRPGGLAHVLGRTCPVPPRGWRERYDRLYADLEAACRSAGVAFSVAANWKPRRGPLSAHDEHLVAVRAAEEQPAVLKEPREVARLAASLADALASDVRLEEFD